jgi:hypothetical protein
MASVADIITTGDNDPEIFPERYYMHYLYCDACGTFELEPWQTQDDSAVGLRKVGQAIAHAVTGAHAHYHGMRCTHCKATYEHGTAFFIELDSNPRNYTMDDVPLPLYNVMQVRGRHVGPAEN